MDNICYLYSIAIESGKDLLKYDTKTRNGKERKQKARERKGKEKMDNFKNKCM